MMVQPMYYGFALQFNVFFFLKRNFVFSQNGNCLQEDVEKVAIEDLVNSGYKRLYEVLQKI